MNTINRTANRITKGQPMPNPTVPLIQILSGKYNNENISGATAALVDIDNPESGYHLLDGPFAGRLVVPGVIGDEINAWRECAAVPISELTFLRDVFMGVETSKNQTAAIHKVCRHLPITVHDESERPTSTKDQIR